MQTIVIVILAVALLASLFMRTKKVKTLELEIAALGSRLNRLGQIAEDQRAELYRMMEVAIKERRMRQLDILNKQKPEAAPPRPPVQAAGQATPDKLKEAARRRFDQSSSGNTWAPDTTNAAARSWDNPGPSHYPYPPAPSSPEPAYSGSGGTFDGGGASGDYGRSDSCSSSTSSDSGSSGSSDSGCSSSSD